MVWVVRWILGIVAVTTSKIEIDVQGLWTLRGYFSWEDFEKAKMKWNGRLLVLGKENMYILPKPKEFIKAIETFKPNP